MLSHDELHDVMRFPVRVMYEQGPGTGVVNLTFNCHFMRFRNRAATVVNRQALDSKLQIVNLVKPLTLRGLIVAQKRLHRERTLDH
jgi:hypothetical protein